MKDLKDKNNLFTSNDIGVKCPKMKRWSEMEEVKDGRFCDGCNEKLYYVGGYTKGEVKALQRRYGKNICVGVSKTVVTASLAFSLSACSGKTSTSEIDKIDNNSSINYDVPVVVGMPIFIEPKEKEKKE